MWVRTMKNARKVNVRVIATITGALATIHRGIKGWLEKTGITEELTMLQKACLLETERILRRVLNS